jgi:hypothetical protein
MLVIFFVCVIYSCIVGFIYTSLLTARTLSLFVCVCSDFSAFGSFDYGGKTRLAIEKVCQRTTSGCRGHSMTSVADRFPLGGTLSTHIGLLTGLRFLNLHTLGLIGTLPSHVTLLTNLVALDLRGNQFDL